MMRPEQWCIMLYLIDSSLNPFSFLFVIETLYQVAVLKFTKDPSFHVVFLSSFRVYAYFLSLFQSEFEYMFVSFVSFSRPSVVKDVLFHSLHYYLFSEYCF